MLNMSKTQRNAVFEAIAAAQLGVSECKFSAGTAVDKIAHDPSGSEIHIFPDVKGLSFRVWAKIGDEPAPDREWSVGAFGKVLDAATSWAVKVSEWVDTPDLWKSVRAGNAIIPGDLSPDSDNTPFTADEQAAISGQLREIAESIKKTHELTAEQSRQIDEKFEAAEKASRRIGRKDWGLLFGGAVFSLILADVITPGVAGHILMMIEHGLGGLFPRPPVGGILSAGELVQAGKRLAELSFSARSHRPRRLSTPAGFRADR